MIEPTWPNGQFSAHESPDTQYLYPYCYIQIIYLY